MPDFSLHDLGLLLGAAIASIAAFGAIAVGPYGRRGARVTLSMLSLVACLGTAAWLWAYMGFVDQRRSIETRMTELRAQALATGSALACLERGETTVESGCERTLFAAPEMLAAAQLYTGARVDALIAATKYAGPRTQEFELAAASLRRSLQADPFGLTARALATRDNCSPQRCEGVALFQDAGRIRENVARKAFEANVARYAGDWRHAVSVPTDSARAPVATLPLDTTGSTPAAPADAPGKPVSEKYSFPSSSSIPPVSIMNDEPAERAPPAAASSSPAAAKEKPPQPAASPPAPEQPARRETRRQNGPLAITPKQ